MLHLILKVTEREVWTYRGTASFKRGQPPFLWFIKGTDTRGTDIRETDTFKILDVKLFNYRNLKK